MILSAIVFSMLRKALLIIFGNPCPFPLHLLSTFLIKVTEISHCRWKIFIIIARTDTITDFGLFIRDEKQNSIAFFTHQGANSAHNYHLSFLKIMDQASVVALA